MKNEKLIQCDWCDRLYDPIKTNWQCPSCGGVHTIEENEKISYINSEETQDTTAQENRRGVAIILCMGLFILALLGVGIFLINSAMNNSYTEYSVDTTIVDVEVTLPSEYIYATKVEATLEGEIVIGYTADVNNTVALIIPEGAKHIANYAFLNNEYIQVLILPQSLESIGVSAFQGCKTLEYIVFSDGLKEVGDYAFFGSAHYEDAMQFNYFPQSITNVGNYAMNNFMVTELPESISVGENAFDYDEYYTTPDEDGFIIIGTTLIKYIGNNVNVTIPDGVTVIDAKAFYSNDSMQSLVMPDSVIHIGDKAFCEADALMHIGFSQNLKSLGSSVFEGCDELLAAHLPEGFERIGDKAFFDCESLAEITIPSTITHTYSDSFIVNEWYYNNYPFYKDFIIGDGLLVDLYHDMTEDIAYIPEGVKSIGSEAVYTHDVDEFIIPEGVISMQHHALYQISIDDDIVIDLPDSLTLIEGALIGGRNTEGHTISIKCSNGSYAYNYARENGYNIILSE